jgi:intracellular septation protein A
MKSENPTTPKSEHSGYSLLFNVILPVLIMTQGDRVLADPKVILILALSGPVVYFFYDYRRRRKANFISILGFVSVLLTGGVGLLELPRRWFIIKETAIPGIIGLAVLGSALSRFPLIRLLVYSREVFEVDRIQQALESRGNINKMDALLRRSTVFLSCSFFISALLNFILASHFVKTEPEVDATQFNAEVGAMTGWSFLVIALPSMIVMAGVLFYVLNGVKTLTGLKMEEALRVESQKSNKA